MTTPFENSTPGFAICKRSATDAHRILSDLIPTEERNAVTFEPSAGGLDAVAGGLVNFELDLDDIADAGYLDPKVTEAIKEDLASAGASVIEARYAQDAEAVQGISQAVQELIDRLDSELNTAKKQQRTDEAHIDWLQERMTELSDELNATRADRDFSKQRVAALEEEVVRVRQELEEAADGLVGPRLDEVKLLQKQAQDFQMTLRDLRCRLLEQHREIEALRVDKDLLRAQLSDTEALLRATHHELVGTREELVASQARVEVLSEDLEEAEIENSVMEGWMNDALSRYAALQKELVDTSTSIVA